MTIKPQNPSIDTIILTWGLALRRKAVALRESLLARAIRKLDTAVEASGEAEERLDWSIRQDLDDEADELRAVISDCNKVKAHAEDRLTSILQYLDPDEFYTQRPQVPEDAVEIDLDPIDYSEKAVDEDDAPEGYKAVPWYGTGGGCRGCAFSEGHDPCPERGERLHCDHTNRPDGTEVKFIKRA